MQGFGDVPDQVAQFAVLAGLAVHLQRQIERGEVAGVGQRHQFGDGRGMVEGLARVAALGGRRLQVAAGQVEADADPNTSAIAWRSSSVPGGASRPSATTSSTSCCKSRVPGG